MFSLVRIMEPNAIRLVLAASDPVIPPGLAVPYTGAAPPGRLAVHVAERGGHLHFGSTVDLGLPGPRGLVPQLVAGFER